MEVIIIDSGEDKLTPPDMEAFQNLKITYTQSEKSVCIQRNIGIAKASGSWIFLCDDDIEVPYNYLEKLSGHINNHPEAGAVSGLVLQKDGNEWRAKYPLNSFRKLFWTFIFQTSIWGEIQYSGDNFLMKHIKRFYKKKGNHISVAGWPVITNFPGEYFITPVYGLGASLVKKEWLMNSPYDEVLDTHGIGDNYGVSADFPGRIHVLNDAFVYHHQEPVNRLQKPLQYFRRVLALDYFRMTKRSLRQVKKRWLLWSLFGNLIGFIYASDLRMAHAAFKSIWLLAIGKNPYYRGAKKKQKVVQPLV